LTNPTYEQLERLLESAGLAARGGFHPQPGDALADIDGHPVRTLIMVGFTGTRQWATFANSPEYHDGLVNPLDRWSRRIIDDLAHQLGGGALYPFDGPPWRPFQQWAKRALTLHPSPLGVLIDQTFGLWHSYRGALILTVDVALPAAADWPSPCEQCESKPCLHACPAEAVQPGAYDVKACRQYVRLTETGCRLVGCLARQACPVGAEHAYPPAQAAFYTRAFAKPE
jgi:hypothetical protein